MLTQVYPVLFHIGAILIPSYGALAALGVLLALFLAQRTARIAGVNAGKIWNLCVLALFAAIIAQRLLLVVVNWSDLRHHPSWMLGLGMIHHPLVSLSNRCTIPGRRSPPVDESALNRKSNAFTSVPRLRSSSLCPAPAWTIIPAGLFTTARSSSS